MQTIVSLLKLKPTLIRGNASEILAVAGATGASTRGVDSTATPSDALASGQKLALEYGCIVGISGADDLVHMCCNPPCVFVGFGRNAVNLCGTSHVQSANSLIR